MYGKLFSSMYDGTLATQGPWQALVTFQQLVILADKTGLVDMTAEAIARRTTIPLKIIEQGLERLQEPDDKSRTPTDDGKRIKLVSPNRNWGWQIVNYEHYRTIRSGDERREYHRQYYHLKRKVNSADSTISTLSTDSTKAVSSKQKQYANAVKSKPSASSVAIIPLIGKQEYGVSAEYLAELETAYPAVDGIGTLREIRAWCVSNPTQCKTERGVKRFLNRWFEKVQNRG